MAVSLNDKPNTVIVTGDDTAVVVSGVGIQGGQGEAGTVDVGTVTTGAAGSSASVTNVGNQYSAILDFVIPRGDTGATGPQGPQGDPGDAATVTVGTVTTGAPGSSATVANSGTATDAVLDFTIPRGDTGTQGPQGDPGAPGTAATVSVGTVTTGAPGSSATVANSGTSSAAVLDFAIPRGDTGAQGPQGATGATGAGVAAGGSTGQALVKASSTDYDTTWSTIQPGIPATIIDAKGDLIVGTAADTAARLAVGTTNGQTLIADSTATGGLSWSSSTSKHPRPISTWYGLPGCFPYGISTYTGFADRRVYSYFTVEQRISVSGFTFFCSSNPAGNVRAAVVQLNESTGLSSQIVIDFGDFALSTTGQKTITLGSPTTLQPGFYALIVSTSSTPNIYQYHYAGGLNAMIDVAASNNGFGQPRSLGTYTPSLTAPTFIAGNVQPAMVGALIWSTA